jgi:uncharacterized membrane-anchored protein YhcB (DUF1043 family)
MWTDSDWQILAVIIAFIVGIVILFAVLKLFTIAAMLKEILAELKHDKGAEA